MRGDHGGLGAKQRATPRPTVLGKRRLPLLLAGIAATTLAVIGISTPAQALSINVLTPTLVQCTPTILVWTGGTPPFNVSVTPTGQPTRSLGSTILPLMTWKVDARAGTVVTFSVKDSTSAPAYTDSITVQPSDDSSCL